MYKFGDIIYFDNLILDDGTIFSNNKIPCVYLCEYDDTIYTMRLSANKSKDIKKRKNYIHLNEKQEIDSKTFKFINVRLITKRSKNRAIELSLSLCEEDVTELESMIKSLIEVDKIYELIHKQIQSEKLSNQPEIKEVNDIKKSEENVASSKKVEETKSSITSNKEIEENTIASSKTIDDAIYKPTKTLSMNDLYPNGTGRTKEEFERDTKDIYKKYTLYYIDSNNKQH